MPHPVRFFSSAMPGAPVLSNNRGDMIALLDACLVTGFNTKAVVSASFADGKATFNVGTGHGFQVDQVTRFSGANEAGWNTDFLVTSVTSSTVTAITSGTPPPAASGTLALKVAPLGFEKRFASTLKAVYRSTNVLSKKHNLRVDENLIDDYNVGWSKWAGVNVFEDMADIDTPIGARGPYDGSFPIRGLGRVPGTTSYGWFKWYYDMQMQDNYGGRGAGPRNWVLVGDDRSFYLFNTVAPNFDWYWRTGYGFGEIQSFKPGDNYGTFLHAHDKAYSDSSYSSTPSDLNRFPYLNMNETTGRVVLRSFTQVGNAVAYSNFTLSTKINNTQFVSGFDTGITFPNGPDYGVLLHPMYVRQDSNVRGVMPGVMAVHNDQPLSDMAIMENVTGYPGRRFLMVTVNNDGNPYPNVARVALDITGPWQ